MSIKLLEPTLVQRIAAGEVIDRPSSVVRELLDNSIDAGASSISLYIENGGIDSIIVKDDGKGMSKEDLALTCHSHATSKLSTIDDLFNIKTLGFRGEALYSIAACSTLTIASNGYSKTVDNTQEKELVDFPALQKGTMITVLNLFAQIPARRMFLKRAVTEATNCKNMLIEKALAFPQVEFKFYNENELKLHLPSTTAQNRVCDALSTDPNFIAKDTQVFTATNENFSLLGIGTISDSFRSDRSHIKIFVNNHCIDDFSLVTSIVNGYSEQFPGGRFPYFYLFITINPELVDFNIHPAKRECRIRIKSQVQGWIINTLREQLRKPIKEVKPTTDYFQPELTVNQNNDSENNNQRNIDNNTSNNSNTLNNNNTANNNNTSNNNNTYDYNTSVTLNKEKSYVHSGFEPSDLGSTYKPHDFGSMKESTNSYDGSWFEKAKNLVKQNNESIFKAPKNQDFKYIGQAFNLFLIVEKDDKLLFVDQHAAHERILYDKFKVDKQIQRLLIPHRFEVDRDVHEFLLNNSFIYSDFGIELTSPEDLVWEINTIPQISKGIESKIADFIINHTGDLEEIERSLFSTMACRAAIKAGDELDALSAKSLLEKVFALEVPCCPHGRLFITEMSKDALKQAVGRFN